MSIRLLIADDHQMIREGLIAILNGTEIEVVAEAATGAECIEKIEQTKPDIVLLDIRMPDLDGLEVLERLREKGIETKVIILSTYDNPTYVARSAALGARDYVLKGSSREEIINTIRAVMAGQGPTHTGELRRVADAMQTRATIDDDSVPLTQRELQVLRHVALGLSNKEIGRSLDISVETVKEHVQNILRKIAVSDRTQAAVWAVRKGLV
ncbi:MAG: DNA-binding response regulator [Planctomycetota bacterium]|nr:MAG: DNA-binding response regulator [Planctomycetota bacterium]